MLKHAVLLRWSLVWILLRFLFVNGIIFENFKRRTMEGSEMEGMEMT